MEAMFCGQEGGDEIRLGGLTVRFLIDGPVSGASVTMFTFEVQSGAKVPATHRHDAYDETIYGLEGVLTMTIEGKVMELGVGESLFIPRGVAHRFDNPLPASAKALAVITPGILGAAYFKEIAAVMKAAAGGPPDMAMVAAVMKKHGLTPCSQI